MERNKTGTLNIYKDYLKETAKNILMGSTSVQKWRQKRPRAGGFYTGKAEELERYAFSSLNFLEKYVGGVRGKSVCEIGAGDFLTSGLAILAAGASRYAVIDRYPGDYTGEIAKNWYRGIEANWAQTYPEIPWADYLKAEDFPENYGDRLELIKQPIEIAQTDSRFDIVCSFQVGEHISDIDAFCETNKRLMNKPNGAALHRVDYGPHDSWFPYYDPLTYLRFSDRAWKLTGSNRGAPNRFRHHEFMAAFEGTGLAVEIVFSDDFKAETIDFSRLHPRFQAMPRESILLGTAIYLLRLK